MANLTGVFTGSNISKGQSNTITLNKTSLNALFSDTYFDTLTNWQRVIAVYKNPAGQVNSVVFNAEDATPVGDFNPSSLAVDGDWEIQRIVILDFDGGRLVLDRGDLTTADFDILLSVVVGTTGGFNVEDSTGTATYTVSDTEIEVTGNPSAWGVNARSVNSFAADGYVEFTIPTSFGSYGHTIIGITNNATQDASLPYLSSIGPCFYFIPSTAGYQIRPSAEASEVLAGTGLVAGDVIRIELVGSTITFKQNASVLYTDTLANLGATVSSPRHFEAVFNALGKLDSINIGTL